MRGLPVINVAPLAGDDADARDAVGREIGAACRDLGFFYATGHAIGAETLSGLEAASRAFFALPEDQKMQIAMAKGGRAWRGYFPVGGELTSGKPDRKQGLYFGEELGENDARVIEGWPLHGRNQFPDAVPTLKPLVLRFMDEATQSAHAIMEGVALSLGLDAQYFRRTYTRDPTLLFRIFEYPADASSEAWGVGEHTDYGLLTLLAQDEHGGLQVRTPSGWIDAPPIEGALVCNIGDMLDRLTGGYYKSTPHRVRNVSGKSRLSFPFFFDPAFDAEIEPLPNIRAADDSAERWDRVNVHAWRGTYGEYLVQKVEKVFPDLAAERK